MKKSKSQNVSVRGRTKDKISLGGPRDKHDVAITAPGQLIRWGQAITIHHRRLGWGRLEDKRLMNRQRRHCWLLCDFTLGVMIRSRCKMG